MSDGVGSPQLAQARTSVDDGVVVVTLTGEVDMANAEEMRSALQAELDARPGALVVDLTLDFLGSEGLLMLVDVQRRARQDGVAFGVVASSHRASRPLELCGLAQTLPMFGTTREAVRSLRTHD